MRYAICIEEMEAWLLPLFESKDSVVYDDPKKKFEQVLNKKRKSDKSLDKKIHKLKHKGEFDKINFYSKAFRKKRALTNAQKLNQSLHDFVETLVLD